MLPAGSVESAGSPKRKRSSSSYPDKSPYELSSPATAAERPWNLRARRAACYAPEEINRRRDYSSAPPSLSPFQPERSFIAKSIQLRSESAADEGERRKFSIPLSHDEIKEDFLLIKGMKPPRRPRKKAKILRKPLDSLFPGFRVVLKAQQLFPELNNISQMLTVCEVHCSAETKVNGETDWYGILQVETTADESLIKKQYCKLVLLFHPHKNSFAGAEAAFKLIGEAHMTLSDKVKQIRDGLLINYLEIVI